MSQRYRITRPLFFAECPWLDQPVSSGSFVYRCTQPTYGCIGPNGTAVTRDPNGGYPFFEVPTDALEIVS